MSGKKQPQYRVRVKTRLRIKEKLASDWWVRRNYGLPIMEKVEKERFYKDPEGSFSIEKL